jgi:hypothetical protein
VRENCEQMAFEETINCRFKKLSKPQAREIERKTYLGTKKSNCRKIKHNIKSSWKK